MSAPPKTILHVVAEPDLGLAARQLALLASDPDPTFVHKVAIVHKDPALAAYFAACELHVFSREQPAASALWPFAFVAGRWLGEIAARTHADLIHAHDARAAGVAAAVAHRASVPFVRTLASARGVDTGGLAHPIAHFTQRFELKRTRLFVATSECVRRGLLRGVPLLAPKMALAPTALPPQQAGEPLRPLERGARLRLHLVGVPPHQDGVVVQALREVADLVIGDDTERALDFDAVMAAGAVPLGRDADEPVELAVLRGMAQGRPALVVPGGVFEELASPPDAPDAWCGVVARDASVAALVAAVQELAARPVGELGTRARTLFEREHSAAALRARYRGFYASALTP